MSRLSHLRLAPAVAYVPLTIIGVSFLLTLSGCPGGAELEDPQKYGIAGMPVTASGGTSGGTGGSGSGATGGSAGTGSNTTLTVNCTGTTYQQALASCNGGGCHAAMYSAADLNLVADAGLVSRLKDVASKHSDIGCSGSSDTTCTCVNYYCSTPPASCPSGALLVDSSDYTKSWLLTKVDNANPMCGAQMPYAEPYKTPNDKACIEAMVQAIAQLPK